MFRDDFPLLVNQPKLVYLDSANTSLKPQIVVNSVKNYYENYSANIGRATYDLSEFATKMYDSARAKIADFINANSNEIIFTHSATYAINQVAFGLQNLLQNGDIILLTEYEHNSNIVVWQKIAAKTGAKIAYIDEKFDENKVKIFSYNFASNVTGEIFNHDELAKKIRARGGFVLIDATQIVGRKSINVADFSCDFLVFSSHKIYGPSGIGALFARSETQSKLESFVFGSQTFSEISRQNVEFLNNNSRFEPGTPNIEGAIGFGAAIDFLNKISMKKVQKHDENLTNYAKNEIEKNGLAKYLIGEPKIGIFSFNHEIIHPHDFALLLNQENIAVRAGKICSDILMQKLKLDRGITRISFGIYTTKSDIDKFICEYKKIIEKLQK